MAADHAKCWAEVDCDDLEKYEGANRVVHLVAEEASSNSLGVAPQRPYCHVAGAYLAVGYPFCRLLSFSLEMRQKDCPTPTTWVTLALLVSAHEVSACVVHWAGEGAVVSAAVGCFSAHYRMAADPDRADGIVRHSYTVAEAADGLAGQVADSRYNVAGLGIARSIALVVHIHTRSDRHIGPGSRHTADLVAEACADGDLDIADRGDGRIVSLVAAPAVAGNGAVGEGSLEWP